MTRVLTIVFAICLAGVAATAQEWNQWRGGERTAEAPGFQVPASWPERPKLAWLVKDAGEGHASPVIAGDRVFLHSRAGEQEVIAAYELSSGKQIWRDAYDAPYEMSPAARGHGKGPKSTPVVHDGRLFTVGITGIVSGLDAASGRVIWRKDFRDRFPVTAPEFGTAMSPLVDGSEVLAHLGGDGRGALVALDVRTGAERWAWKEDGPGYASPILATFDDVRQVITQSQRHVIGLSRAEGRLLWRIPFTTPYEQNIVTPVVHDGLLIYSGLDRPVTAVRLRRQGATWAVEQVWQNPDVPMYMSSPVVSDGLLFGLTHRNRGQFFCLDAATGKLLWTSRGREGENAALLVARDVLLALTTAGELAVVRRSAKQFDLVRRYTLAETPVWSHPAPHRNGLVVKDATSLAYWTF